MNRSHIVACTTVLAFCALAEPHALDAGPISFSVLHSFDTVGTNYNGPLPTLIQSGSVLFGTVSDGTNGIPFMYRVNNDGTNYQVLYTFNNAFAPGELSLAGSTLYGPMDVMDGSANRSIFRINLDGTGYQSLHSFPFGVSPVGPVTISGSTMYGMANGPNSPQVFRMSLDGTGFQALHSFTTTADGSILRGRLLQLGSTLYGIASQGGNLNGAGTLFRINTDGTGFSVLHDFLGGITDGRSPQAGLATDGTFLYGTTFTGGLANDGTIYKIKPDGTGFQLVYAFNATGDAAYPTTQLSLFGSTLFGTTNGSNGQETFGTVFSVNTDGSGEQVLYGGSSAQTLMQGTGVEVDGSAVIGVGDLSRHPGLFAITGAVPEPSTLALALIGNIGFVIIALRRRFS